MPTIDRNSEILINALIERIKTLETDLYLRDTEIIRLKEKFKEELAKRGEGVG